MPVASGWPSSNEPVIKVPWANAKDALCLEILMDAPSRLARVSLSALCVRKDRLTTVSSHSGTWESLRQAQAAGGTGAAEANGLVR